MKRFLFIFFVACIIFQFNNYFKESSKRQNDIDQLSVLLSPISTVTKVSDTLIYLSNNESAADLFFKTQFVLSPLRLVQTFNCSKLSKHLVLYIYDLKKGSKSEVTNTYFAITDTIMSRRDSNYSFILLRQG